MDKNQKLKNDKVNSTFKKGDTVIYKRNEYTFVDYLDYGFTCRIKNTKTKEIKHIFSFDKDIKLKM